MPESMRVMLLTLCTWLMAASAVHATELQWWSHWAIEDNKKVVLFEAKRRFEAKNPGHSVTITFYEKEEHELVATPRIASLCGVFSCSPGWCCQFLLSVGPIWGLVIASR